MFMKNHYGFIYPMLIYDCFGCSDVGQGMKRLRKLRIGVARTCLLILTVRAKMWLTF
jgi:hypothetical protein